MFLKLTDFFAVTHKSLLLKIQHMDIFLRKLKKGIFFFWSLVRNKIFTIFVTSKWGSCWKIKAPVLFNVFLGTASLPFCWYIIPFEISGSQDGEHEDDCLLGCRNVRSLGRPKMRWRTALRCILVVGLVESTERKWK